MEKAFDSGKLKFFGTLEPLRDRRAFGQQWAQAKAFKWVVYAKRPFAGPPQVLDYVGRYTHRVAISNHRLSRSKTIRSALSGKITGRAAKSKR